jgi:hypothetical protein
MSAQTDYHDFPERDIHDRVVDELQTRNSDIKHAMQSLFDRAAPLVIRDLCNNRGGMQGEEQVSSERSTLLCDGPAIVEASFAAIPCAFLSLFLLGRCTHIYVTRAFIRWHNAATETVCRVRFFLLFSLLRAVCRVRFFLLFTLRQAVCSNIRGCGPCTFNQNKECCWWR